MKRFLQSKWTIILFFIILTAVGLWQSCDYGKPIDETTEQAILRSNLLEYANRLFGVDSAISQKAGSFGDLPITQSIERDHGQCVYYPIAILLWLLKESPDLLMMIWHGYTFLWFMLGVVAVYTFSRNAGLTKTVSLLGSLLLYLSPRFYAEGHYNSKDIILLSLFLLVFASGIRLMKNPSLGCAFLFSLLGAACSNTRIIGFLPWGIIGLMTILKISLCHQWNIKTLLTALTAVCSFLIFYFLLTPASWSGIIPFLRYLLVESGTFSRWNGVVLFRGEFYSSVTTALPRSYLFQMIAVTLPLYVLPLSAAGGMHLIHGLIRFPKESFRSEKWLCLCACSICCLFPLLYASLTRANVYNGWRHLYFVYSGIVLLGVQGISSVHCFLRKHGGNYGMHHVFAAGLALFMAYIANGMVSNHPYEYGYYNILAHESASKQEMEMDWWCVSTENALNALNSVERNEALPLEVGAIDDITQISLERSNCSLSENSSLSVQPNNTQAAYLLVNPLYSKIYGLSDPKGYHRLFSLKSYDIDLCIVFEKDSAS